jgi:2-oxoacid:acceptor oxidoreductase delta subunit (pyruvate/2-ketoisovalerate family)
MKCNVQGPCAYRFASGNTGSWRIVRPSVDTTKCVRCGTCEMVCPANVITIDKDRSNTDDFFDIMWDYCKGCGICANECPMHCIEMVREERGEE